MSGLIARRIVCNICI